MAKKKGEPARDDAAKKLPKGIKLRGKVYYANVQVRGKRLRGRLASELSVAKEVLAELVAREYRRGVMPATNDYPWASLTKEYLQLAEQRISSANNMKSERRAVDRFTTLTGVTNVRDVTRDLIIDYRAQRLRQPMKSGRMPSARTINKEVDTVSHMLREAVEARKIAFNPIAGMSSLREEKLRKVRRSLEVAEVQRLLAVSPARLRNVWWMLLNTGMRARELRTLLFSDIDFKSKTLTVRQEVAKSRRSRTIPLGVETMTMLRQLKADAAAREPHYTTAAPPHLQAKFSREHVFVNARRCQWSPDLLKAFQRSAAKAGIDDAINRGSVDVHSLRVTHITIAIDSGADVKAVSENVGHADPALTLRVYKKANANRRREAVEVLPFKMPTEMAQE